MSDLVTPVTITANANHAQIERMSGWSIRAAENGTAVNFRIGAVDGQICGVSGMKNDDDSDTQNFGRTDVVTVGGVYVQVVSGSLSAGVIYSG